MNRPTITATTTNSSTGVALDKFSTPKKAFAQAMTNSKTKMSSGRSSKLCSLFSNDKPQGFLFKNYSSTNLNNLLGSDFKFKSPSKLIEAKISMSPWKAEESYRISFSKIFESSPMRASNYKLTRAEMEAQHQVQRVHSKDLPSLATHPRKFSNFPAAYSNPYIVPNMGQIDHIGMNNHRMSCNDDSSLDDSNTNRKRKRKNTMQLKILKQEYIKNKEWSKELITKISNMTGLTESQIYKWNWDQKKKEEDEGVTDSTSKSLINGCNLSNSKIQLSRRLNDKENMDIDDSNFKLVGLHTPNKNKFQLLGPNHKRSSKLATNGSKLSDIECEVEPLGKRRAFGQVNDSRVNSHAKGRRYKQLKI